MFKTFSPRHAAVALLTSAPVLAFAQATDPFADAVSDLTTKITTWGAALAGLAAVGVGFMVAVKYIKKIRGAA